MLRKKVYRTENIGHPQIMWADQVKFKFQGHLNWKVEIAKKPKIALTFFWGKIELFANLFVI